MLGNEPAQAGTFLVAYEALLSSPNMDILLLYMAGEGGRGGVGLTLNTKMYVNVHNFISATPLLLTSLVSYQLYKLNRNNTRLDTGTKFFRLLSEDIALIDVCPPSVSIADDPC